MNVELSEQDPEMGPAETIILAADARPSERIWVAAHQNTPIEILTRLATDRNTVVRVRVASNPATPAEILATMATDPHGSVRRAAAKNPSCPEQIRVLAQLRASDADPDW